MIEETKTTTGAIAWVFDDGKIVMKLPASVPTEITLTNESAIELAQELINAVKKNQALTK